MSIKNNRHQSVISRQSDSGFSEDHWLKQFEQKLQKAAVQPRNQESLFDQINTIMNGKSKHTSVQAAVDDMMERSGLTSYLDISKTSKMDNETSPKKTAALEPDHNEADVNLAKVIKIKPSVLRTLENIIKETKGNLSVPAVISRLHSLHARDISDESAWEEDKLIRLVSKYNLKAKADNPATYEDYDNLGQGDHSSSDSDIDASNTDAFSALMPAKF